MTKYDVELRYIQGKTNVIADALSRFSHMKPPMGDNEVPLVKINLFTNTLKATPAKLNEICDHTSQDPVLSYLKELHTMDGLNVQTNAPQTWRIYKIIERTKVLRMVWFSNGIASWSQAN